MVFAQKSCVPGGRGLNDTALTHHNIATVLHTECAFIYCRSAVERTAAVVGNGTIILIEAFPLYSSRIVGYNGNG